MGNDDGHNHPDLAIREANLAKLMAALREAGAKMGPISDSRYTAGYTSYRNHERNNHKSGLTLA